MTFEEFKALALNPPRRKEESIFEVTMYEVKDLPERRRNHYPSFEVECSRIGFTHTIEDAEQFIAETIKAYDNNIDDIYCFHVKEYPIGRALDMSWPGYGLSWRLYDNSGRILDKTYCSSMERDLNTRYGFFRGRTDDMQRFQEGDIVEVLRGTTVSLGVVASSGLSVEWCWDYRNRVMSPDHTLYEPEIRDAYIDSCYFQEAGDDQSPVINGPSYATHRHVHTLNIMPLRYPLSKRLLNRYNGYYKAMLREEEKYSKQQEL